ncbi:MAG TPA: DNA translocase FtsK 4TM domain-containing protein [Anaeromyxobacteraceae bacterium]|jgi:S-DNA-T family DNA segregation ATPase FtsK/SpoIIIE|nr:DNA translocase FtsK 4TM domain-containing protein [Anaeromyxobacteraceae bacterium]
MGKGKNRKGAERRGERAEGGARGTGMKQDIAAVLLFTLGLALLLALASFSSHDGEFIDRGLAPAGNLVGKVGHYAALGLYGVLGFSALVLPVAICTGAIRLFRAAPPRLTAIAAAAYAVLTLSVATLAQLFVGTARLASFPAGGAVGRALCRNAEGLFGAVGTALVVGACAVVALILAADLDVVAAAGGLGRAARWAGAFLFHQTREAVDRHREAVAELREAEAAEKARRAEDEAAEAEAAARAEAALAAGEAEVAANETLAEDDDPAWARELNAAPLPPEEPKEEKPPRRKKAEDACESKPLVVVPPPEPAAAAAPPSTAPAEAAAEPGRPEIVLSSAMQERKKKKDKEEKEEPSFAFTQSGAVFTLPALGLLDKSEVVEKEVDEGGLQRTAGIIVATLKTHGVDGLIRHIRPGPVVTLYEFSPVAGVKLAKIENLDKELTMALSATRIRIIAPIPGKGVVGIEVPNRDRATVFLKDVLESETFAQAGGLLPLALGKNIEGIPYCVDLQRMPHLLIAGTTGSGKSVGLNTMILSMLYRQTPDQVRMIMVDPKMTELSIYEDIPHLLLPVVTDPQKATRALQWAVDEMERRTQILADTGSKDLKSYNGKVEKQRAQGVLFEEAELAPAPKKLVVVDVAAGETEEEAEARARAGFFAPRDAASMGQPPDGFDPIEEPLTATAEYEDPTAPPPADPVAARDERKQPQKLPYIVVVIDELADLMMTAPREVEISLARLAQKARATGIHLMVATQRPSTDVVTGMIKNNFPARITFRLASRHDSATIINGPGAESLLGDGDMLVLTATQPVTRVQGAFVSEGEIERVVSFLKEQGRPVYDQSILKARDSGEGAGRGEDEDDPVYDQAIDLVSRMEEVSVSKLQREMRLGYNKAAKIIERMEREGIVGPPNGVKPRQVLVRPIGEARAETNV